MTGQGQRIDMGTCISFGMEILKKEPMIMVVGGLIGIVINSVTMGLLIGPILLGFFRAVKMINEGEKPDISVLFSGFQGNQFLPSLIAGILCVVAISIGSMLCIIPGLLVSPLLPLSIYLILLGETDGVNAIKRSLPSLKVNLLMSVLVYLVLAIIGSLGLVLCFIGVLLTLPITLAGTYKLAEQMAPDAE